MDQAARSSAEFADLGPEFPRIFAPTGERVNDGEPVAQPTRVPTSSTALRVGLFVTAKIWGGAEQQAWLLACGLRERGHHVEIFCRSNSPFARRVIADGMSVLEFAGTGRDPFTLWRIRRHLWKLRPDVLHFNDPHGLTTGGVAAVGLPVPVRLASRRSSFPIRNPGRYRRLCDGVLCVATEVARVCRESGVDGPEIDVVHSGSVTERIQQGDRTRGRQHLQLHEQDILLLTVAMLHDCKGHRYLLEALATLVKINPRIHLALAGEGPLRVALQTQADELGVSQHVKVLGHCPNVPDLLQACDLFVMPTVQEGICGALIEAMLANRPIVTTTVGGIPDVVGPPEIAATRVWPVPSHDAAAIATAVLDALQSHEERAARAARSQQHALRHFTHDQMVNRTLAVYQRHVARAATRSPSRWAANRRAA